MLHILGMILKIAGILLGSILGMMLLILLLILFVPVCYRINGSYKEKPDGTVRISWLLSAFSLRICFGDQGLTARVKILGIPLGRRRSRMEKEEKAEPKEAEKGQPKPRSGGEKIAEPEAERHAQAEKERRPAEIQEPDFTQKSGKRISLAEKIRARMEKIKCTIRGICDKIKAVRLKKEKLQSWIRDERNREAFRLIKKQLAYLWKHIRPRKFSLSCRFGFDDPSLTGQALAAGALLYPFYRNKVKLYPDFEQKVLEGEAYMSGRIRIFPLLLIIIRLWKNRQIRAAVGKFMK